MAEENGEVCLTEPAVAELVVHVAGGGKGLSEGEHAGGRLVEAMKHVAAQ